MLARPDPARRKSHPTQTMGCVKQELNAWFWNPAEGIDVALRVVLEGDDASGYSATSPDLPACLAAADEATDCLRLFREAAAVHLSRTR